jgi:MFS transporter, PAT family, beta-lactamase induction signal transducer AmpG
MANSTAIDGWRGSLAVYGNRRQLVIFLMGFSSGLPLLLGFSTLSYWLAKEGVALAAIGGLLTVSTPYSLKFLWAPALDHVRLPFFTNALGRRRGWALFIQILLMAAIVALGASDPADNLVYMAVAALVVAFLSASQDIVIDAYRIEILDEAEQGAGAAMTQAGYRIGLLAAGAGALALADFIDWFWVYTVMAALVSVGMIAVLIAPEPESYHARETRNISLRHAVIEPFAEFLTRNGLKGTVVILAFVLLYKYGDAVAGAMANPFYHQIGFSGVEIASVTKALGVAATLVGVFAGGALVAKSGVFTALLVGGVLQALTNLIFAWLATVGADISILAIAVGADSFTGGLGSAAFVAYLSGLCNVAFTGTQFALLTSLMALGRTVLAASSGFIAEQAGWAVFFITTTGLAVPGLLLLLWVSRLPNSLSGSRPPS